MVLQKRLDYGFNGYQVPRAARSVRRRCLFKRRTDDRQMCAFDLLATVAGKLSDEDTREQPAVGVYTTRKDTKDENTPLEEKACSQVFHVRNFLFTELVSKAPDPNVTSNDAMSKPASVITTSDCSEKVGSAEKLNNDDCKLSLGIIPAVDVNSSGLKLSSTSGLLDGNSKNTKIDSGPYSSWHLENAPDKKPNALASSVCEPFSINRDNVNLGSRDDDENSFECTEACNSIKAFKPLQQDGNGRFQKFLDSKHSKTAPNLRDDKHFNIDTEKSNYPNTNNFKRQRSPMDYPFKKRKLYSYSSTSNFDQGISDGTCGEPKNGTDEVGLDSCTALPGVISTPASAAECASFHSKNAQVKLKIKSFRVPELFIEVPETATVGSLKRTVMEAVNALLGSGLRVGVLLQGKRIRDDNKTLLQAGISHENKMDSLGFTLEPEPATTPVRPDCPNLMLCESPQPLARYPPAPSITRNTPSISQNTFHLGNRDLSPDLTRTSLNNFVESDHDSAPSPHGMSFQRMDSESKALIPVPPTRQDSMSVVALRRCKRSESAQRRIRRPFTVAEVEALVQAVEKLGTGRWRDVKLRAFDNAKHRTYVDLKDKWKTLVHTARISPQQRRGEPVPQELLDRVLTAHAYWSQQQAKQQLKSRPDTCLLL